MNSNLEDKMIRFKKNSPSPYLLYIKEVMARIMTPKDQSAGEPFRGRGPTRRMDTFS